ncbi:MAG: hypothetical protein HC764_19920 [Pleurocapsa sp. CRU_1_2]|nr:hypothetical protein [Pleurocapsa sp. CRU_1_2]
MGLLLGWVIDFYSVIFPQMSRNAIAECHSRYFLLVGFREIAHEMTEGNFAHFPWHFTMCLVIGVVFLPSKNDEIDKKYLKTSNRRTL